MDVSAILSSAALPPGSSSSLGGGAGLQGGHSPAQQRKAAATQFEAILLRQFLNDSMTSLMGGEDSPSGSVYGYMLTDVMAGKLAQGGGMGLGKIIQQQLTPRGDSAAGPASSEAIQ